LSLHKLRCKDKDFPYIFQEKKGFLCSAMAVR